MNDFGDVRSAIHNSDMRALIEASYRKRRYVLHEMHERYISDNLPEYEHEVYRWACAMVNYLLEVTNVPHAMVRAFAATWAEWMLAGAVNEMPIYLTAGFGSRRDNGYVSVATHDFAGGPLEWQTTHELCVELSHDPSGWCVKWGNGYD